MYIYVEYHISDMHMIFDKYLYIIITLLRQVIFNDMTELSATILELIFESDMDSVAQDSKPVCGE